MNTFRFGSRVLPTLSGDRRSFLVVSAFILLLSGAFALVLGVTGRFLPHDEQFLGMTAEQLCALRGCRIVHFMIHDRISFGGAIFAIGLLYLWLVTSPLREGEAWAWWLLVLSGAVGFGSFFAYLGYGYFDTWHAVATVGLLACFVIGLVPSSPSEGWHCLLRPATCWPWSSQAGLGKACLLASATGLVFGGLTILIVGTTCVFVPQDLAYLGLSVDDLHGLNPRLVPLIAHDRAGFGGAVCSSGIALFFCTWCGTPSRGLWLVLALAGAIGFGTAIGVHPAVGYNDLVHLAPAIAGAILHLAGLVLTFRAMTKGSEGVCPLFRIVPAA